MIYMNVRTYGADKRLGFCRECLTDKKIPSVREIILLPIPTSRDEKTVSGLGKAPSEIFDSSDSGAVAVGYGIPKSFKECFAELGISVADVSLDEAFLEENAMLTAVGTVGKILTEHSAAPTELSVGIIGYGRIGRRLLNILAFLGARLTVFTSKKTVAEELCMEDVSGVCLAGIGDDELLRALLGLDILINTAPAPLIKGELLSCLPNTEILELASGNNFPPEARVTRLPAIPARMYPKSAGKALADSVIRMIG